MYVRTGDSGIDGFVNRSCEYCIKLNDALDAEVVVFLAYVGSNLRELSDEVGIHSEVVCRHEQCHGINMNQCMIKEIKQLTE